MNNGNIARTHLSPGGAAIRTLEHGWHPVTGGLVNIGYLGNGTVSKITGILVHNQPDTVEGFNYVPFNQPFNRNFASVLFEIRAAGKPSCSFSTLDYVHSGRGDNMLNLHSQYLRGFRQSMGLGLNSQEYGEVTITDALLNGLAR